MIARVVLLALLWISGGANAADIPLNPAVTQETIAATICVRGYATSVRPKLYLSRKVKHQLMDAAGLPWVRRFEFELDHKQPLTLGGAPLELENFELQPWPEALVKDGLERRLNRLVCRGVMSLPEAQACIWNDWRACAETLKGN